MGLLFFIFKIYCCIHVSAFWEKWRIRVSLYRVPVSVSAYPCNIGPTSTGRSDERQCLNFFSILYQSCQHKTLKRHKNCSSCLQFRTTIYCCITISSAIVCTPMVVNLTESNLPAQYHLGKWHYLSVKDLTIVVSNSSLSSASLQSKRSLLNCTMNLFIEQFLGTNLFSIWLVLSLL